MKLRQLSLRELFLHLLVGVLAYPALAADPIPTGPETEKRFPPLVVPAGFKATLYACDPLIEYPSAIAVGPPEKPGSAFVAIDYMTGLGTEIVRRDEIRLIEDANRDGYADKATVYADGFNSIMGLTFHQGTVYVMHSPFLTALRDTDGDGRADERRDLLKGLGLPPEENPVRLHCANGIVMGHDGWLYLALGDHGCDVPRPEGDRLVHHGGAILRCRADGRELHVFASGLRNIYDVALDDELNVFVRDNENDGGDYKLRLCHSFFGADHGYPYLYYERPAEALPPLADLGLGSSAGGVCYLETQFPAEYRGSLFFCEWGRAVVRSHPVRSEAFGFKPLTETQFAAGADNDPYGFEPTDVVVDRDGSLLVADWCDGQRPKRGRGRIYRIASVVGTGAPARRVGVPSLTSDPILQLGSESYYERCAAQEKIAAQGDAGVEAMLKALNEYVRLNAHARMHAVWILARAKSPAAQEKLWELADRDVDRRVQVQAIRALADHPAAGKETAQRLARLLPRRGMRFGPDPGFFVADEIIIAVGRLGWEGAPQWLAEWLPASSQSAASPPGNYSPSYLGHAIQQTLRRSRNWPEVVKLLDLQACGLRDAALGAVANQWSTEVADGVIARLKDERPARRNEYADALARVHQRPGLWTYWGYRPPPRPANSVRWERTEQIEQVLNGLLLDPDSSVRLAVLRHMQRERVPAKLDSLATWLATEREAEAAATLLAALRDQPNEKLRPILAQVVADRGHTAANRATAIGLLSRAGSLPAADLLPLFGDEAPLVRAAAATAAGKLQIREALTPLLRLATDADPQLRRASLDALRQLKEPRVVPLAARALADRTTQLTALLCLAELGGPEQSAAVIDLARADPGDAVTLQVVGMLAGWSSRAKLAADERTKLRRAAEQLQGQSGLLAWWQVAGPLSADEANSLRERLLAAPQDAKIDPAQWKSQVAASPDARVSPAGKSPGVWLATADFDAAQAGPAQILASASGKFQVWLNGQFLYRRDEPRAFQPDSDRLEAELAAGRNRLVLQLDGAADPAVFQVRFRRKSAAADLERLMQAALTRKGDPARGREVFFSKEAQCSKCHRVGDAGERIGPELTGLGGRFSKIHIIESILEPSRTVTPGFQSFIVRLLDGRVLSGVRVAETRDALTIADQQGQKHVLPIAEIDVQQPAAKSTMPDNLAQQLSQSQFLDLIAFLTAQREAPAP